MPVEDVAELIGRWRRARSPAEQVRVLAAGSQTVRSLSGTDRQVIAQALRERGAAEVADRFATATPRAPSSTELRQLAGTLRRVDPAELDQLAATLADPDERRRLSTAAGAAPPPAADQPPPPTGAPIGPPVHLPPPVAAPPVTSEPATPDPDVPDPDVPDPDAPVSLAEAEHDLVDPAPAVGDDAVDASVTRADASEPVAARAAGPPGVDLEATLEATGRAASVRERLAAVTALRDTPLTSADLATALRALPDGWQRRTAARRLLEAGQVHDVDASEVLGAFERGSDRTAVAQVLLDGGLAHVETLTDHLDPRTADRFRRRAAR